MTQPTTTPEGLLSRRVLLAAAATLGLSACAGEPISPGQTTPSGSAAPSPADTQPAETSTPSAETPAETDTPSPTPTRASDPSWDADSRYVLVNKRNPLEPANYEPDDLRVLDLRGVYETPQMMRAEAAEACEDLFAAAAAEGLALAVSTAYRGFEHQRSLYETRYAERGQQATDESTARPGYSEHQTGLAVDLASIENPECQLGQCFGETPEGMWVAEHAHEFGFIIRYPDGAEAQEITGYFYEPWHLRYLGVETATEVVQAGVTLEEYWEQPPAPDYEHDYATDPHLHS
ncbi:D-alanyl-D-alanine carboxypeptidase family protein [Nesterenkonia alba]|uniref:D-alanyl-D-alanine carboxypeptidase family protein n=1 Tax=Nesterenkonia alba TaxID=515814 RepID=UPI0004123B0C|nr:D-alanyl-D-alanine carboxypeptidase family protein [Nesterenkonia alba]